MSDRYRHGQRRTAEGRRLATGRRLFVAIDPPISVKDRLGSQIEDYRVSAGNAGVDIRWLGSASLHLTMAFVARADPAGVADICAAAERVAAASGPFELELADAGVFPNLREPSAVWVGVGLGASDLERLANTVRTEMTSGGYPQPDRPFRGHLTIGRLRRPADVGDIVESIRQAEVHAFTVSELVVFESHLSRGPAQYERIGCYQLGR